MAAFKRGSNIVNEDIEIIYDKIYEAGRAYLLIIAGESFYLPAEHCTVYRSCNKIFAPKWLVLKQGLKL